jgi:phospholipid/cholesterol/gamma-HCH transport system substrate-binding protein
MRSTGIKLTIFTLFTMVITVALSTVIGNFSLIADTYSIDAEFDDATGVLNGDLVKIAGVNVGRVTGFEVENGLATVTLQLNAEVQVPENAIVEIKYRNLLGQRVINILEPQGVASNDLLAEGDTIPASQTRPALDLDILFNNLRPLVQSTNPEDINVVARTVLRIFEGKEGDLGAILGNLGDVTKELAGGDGRLVRLVGDLRDVTDVLNNQSGNIRQGLEKFVDLMQALDEITPNIEQAVVQLDTLSTKFHGVLEKNRVNLREDLDDLATVLGLVNDNLGPLDRATANLKEVLLATARSQSYGRWWNLYVANLCPETGFVAEPLGGGCLGPADLEDLPIESAP